MDKTDNKDTQPVDTTQPDNKIGSPIPIISQQNIAPGAIKQRHLVPSPTQKGDMYYGSNGGFANLPVGTSGQVLTILNGVPVWGGSTGSNTNGSYTKFANGTLIQWGAPSYGASGGGPWGTSPYCKGFTITYPISFLAVPYTVAQAEETSAATFSWIGYLTSKTVSGCNGYIFNNVTIGANTTVSWIAVGKWK